MNKNNRQTMKNALQPILAQGMKSYRTNVMLSQEAMAQMLKISVRTYIDIEHGVSLPSTETLVMFMSLLDNADLDALLDTLRSGIQ